MKGIVFLKDKSKGGWHINAKRNLPTAAANCMKFFPNFEVRSICTLVKHSANLGKRFSSGQWRKKFLPSIFKFFLSNIVFLFGHDANIASHQA